ncbi:MAG: hypothetical protein IPL32_18045 [Chloracidobacterium sp.]|nr:hypothetical protein [Chloracidobacterium sp.]
MNKQQLRALKAIIEYLEEEEEEHFEETPVEERGEHIYNDIMVLREYYELEKKICTCGHTHRQHSDDGVCLHVDSVALKHGGRGGISFCECETFVAEI